MAVNAEFDHCLTVLASLRDLPHKWYNTIINVVLSYCNQIARQHSISQKKFFPKLDP